MKSVIATASPMTPFLQFNVAQFVLSQIEGGAMLRFAT